MFERFRAKALLLEILLPGTTTIGTAEEELADGVLDDELEAGVELDELEDGVELEEELAGVELELDDDEGGEEFEELDDWQTTVVVTTLLLGFGFEFCGYMVMTKPMLAWLLYVVPHAAS